jgi:hypothetical protein
VTLIMVQIVLLLALLLAGCTGSGALPEPSGPLRVMNPGQWTYSGNDVLPGARTGLHD